MGFGLWGSGFIGLIGLIGFIGFLGFRVWGSGFRVFFGFLGFRGASQPESLMRCERLVSNAIVMLSRVQVPGPSKYGDMVPN